MAEQTVVAQLALDELGSRTVASMRSDSSAVDALAVLLSMSTTDIAAAFDGVHGKTLVRNVFQQEFELLSGEPIEDLDEEGGTGVELERESDEPARPYDPDKIRVDPKTFSLKQIVDEIATNDIDLAPDFQRERVWKDRQKVRLVESVLLRIPLPAFYFSADPDGRLSVVDGVQRLSTIHAFVQGTFALTAKDLEYLDVATLKSNAGDVESDTCLFGELDAPWRRRFYQTQITANVIDPQTPDQVKFDIFKRINTGGSPLNAQEIRHSMMSIRCRGILKSLSQSEAFLQATPSKIHQHRRMTDREVILRYLAFALLGNVDEYPVESTMDAFLMDAVREIDDPKVVTDAQVHQLCVGFERAMVNARALFGDHAFRKWPSANERLFPFNKALFESWGLALSGVDPDALEKAKDSIVNEVRSAMQEPTYLSSITVSTGDARRVRKRFAVANEILGKYAQ